MAEEVRNGICLSIIVPVYNVSGYLSRCLDSLLLAANTGMTEIILVDDGSTDDSGNICDSYADRYDLISCYHKENGGLSDARNYGLEYAKGKYVFFCDSDDMVIPGGLDKALDTLSRSDVDVLLWDGISIDDNDEVIDHGLDSILTHKGIAAGGIFTGTQAMIAQILDHNKVAMTAWLSVCRRDFLMSNGLVFEKGLIHEDELWTPMVMMRAATVMYLPEKVYCYRMRESSIMGSHRETQEKHAKAFVHILNGLYDIYSENIADNAQRKVILANWADTYLWIIACYEVYKFDCAADIPRGKICSCAGRFKSKVKAIILSVLGAKTYAGMF